MRVTTTTYRQPSITRSSLNLLWLIAFIILMQPMFTSQTIAGTTPSIEVISPAENSVSALRSQAVIVRSTPGTKFELYVNGVLAKTEVTRVDGVADFLNIDVPSGDVRFEVKPAEELASAAKVERNIHILGSPAIILLDVERDSLFADGTSTTIGVVRVLDEWKYPIQEGVVVTVEADSGTILTKDGDRARKGHQIQLQNGIAQFEYKSGKNSGTATLRAQADMLRIAERVELVTPYEDFTLVGLATATGADARLQGDRSQLNSAKSFPEGFEKDGRIAVAARGTIFEKYRLTASFDSDRKDRSRLFRDLDPDFLYSIYGDNSMLFYDAQTSRQLFVKLERNQSYLYYGDYNTDLATQEFTLYSRSLNGAKFNLQDGGWKASGFGSLTDRRVTQIEIRGTGLSGLYQTGSNRITPGSERIRIETRDRFHSEVVLRQTDQYRFSDYEIDYEQGSLFFKQPVPSIDAQGNPVYIVVTYEAVMSQSTSYVAGARLEHHFANGLSFGANGVIEEQEPTNYTLLGGDIKYKLDDRFSFLGELGHSDNLGRTGLAYKMESSVSPLTGLTLKGYYRQVESRFFNITQSGSGREIGTRKYGASGSLQAGQSTKFTSEFYRSTQELATNKIVIQSVAGGIEQRIGEKLTSAVNLEDITYEGDSPDTSVGMISTHSLLGTARLRYSATDRLTLGLQHERNFGDDQDITKPNATSVSGEYKVIDPVSIQGMYKFYEDGGDLSSVGVNSTPMEGTTLYGKYEIGNAIGQHRNMVSIGLKNVLKLPYDLTANFGYEKALSLERRLAETPTEDHVAYFGSLEYLPEDPIKLALKGEYGENNTTARTNISFGGDYRMGNDVSLLAKYRFTKEDARNSEGYQNRHHVITGLAYRPVRLNWFNVVGKYELKHDYNHYLVPFIDYSASIISAHGYLEPVRRVEFGLKYAFRVAEEQSTLFTATSHTHFYLASMRFDVTNQIDIGGEYRLLWQTEARDFLNGYSAEAGYAFANNVRIGGGYNFKGYKDRDLVDYRLWSQGPFVRISLKFDEQLFGLREKK